MRAKKNRDLIIFLILIPVFIWVAFFISSRMENKLPDYSTANKSSMGLSIFFESLKELKFPVEKTLKPVTSQDTNSIQIVVPGGNFDINSNEIKAWLNKGGILVHLAAQNLHFIEYDTLPEIKGKLMFYKYGRGMVIGADASKITNKALMENTDEAYELVSEIGNQGDKKVYFNESHLFSTEISKTLWDYIPLWGRFIIFQLALCLAAFFYYKGKRFGKPVMLYDEVERSENEYLYSASSLYRQSKGYDLMALNYYKNLLKELGSTNEEWIKLWEAESIPELNKAKLVYKFMNDINPKKKQKEYMQIVSIIEQLTSILKRRRDSYWKVLKK